MMRHIPNFITSLNLVSGFIAIIFASNGDILSASWFIFAAMIFDFLDGFSARLLNAYSDMGKELDSLADVISFGAAPAVIIYQLLYDSFSLFEPGIVSSGGLKFYFILITPAIMPVCAALRLAKFNIDKTQSTSFKGLPTPANAIAVISLIFATRYSGSAIYGTITGSPGFMVALTIILSLLMVSRIPLLSLKILNIRFKGNEGRYILVIFVLASFALFGTAAAPLIIPLYIIASLLSLIF